MLKRLSFQDSKGFPFIGTLLEQTTSVPHWTSTFCSIVSWDLMSLMFLEKKLDLSELLSSPTVNNFLYDRHHLMETYVGNAPRASRQRVGLECTTKQILFIYNFINQNRYKKENTKIIHLDEPATKIIEDNCQEYAKKYILKSSCNDSFMSLSAHSFCYEHGIDNREIVKYLAFDTGYSNIYHTESLTTYPVLIISLNERIKELMTQLGASQLFTANISLPCQDSRMVYAPIPLMAKWPGLIMLFHTRYFRKLHDRFLHMFNIRHEPYINCIRDSYRKKLSNNTASHEALHILYYSLNKMGTPLGYHKVHTTPIKEKITIGLDPELEIYKTTRHGRRRVIDFKNGFVSASNYFNSSDKCGTDANSRIVEVRPDAHHNVSIVAQNTRNLIQEITKRLGGISRADYAILAGGGFVNSTGGHIHIGHPRLVNMTYQSELKILGEMLDDFLYYQIKRGMSGSIRQWSKSNIIKKTMRNSNSFEDWIHSIYSRNSTIENVGKKYAKGTRHRGGYDMPSQFRVQPYGIEYRSLPSFIVDFTFTKLVLKIAQKISELFLKSLQTKTTIVYNKPPTKEDYMRFITESEYRVFMEYIKGNKREIFISDIQKNWNTKVEISNMIIDFYEHFGGSFAMHAFEPIMEEINIIKKEILNKYYHEFLHIHSLKKDVVTISASSANLKDIAPDAIVDIDSSLYIFANNPLELKIENVGKLLRQYNRILTRPRSIHLLNNGLYSYIALQTRLSALSNEDLMDQEINKHLLEKLKSRSQSTLKKIILQFARVIVLDRLMSNKKRKKYIKLLYEKYKSLCSPEEKNNFPIFTTLPVVISSYDFLNFMDYISGEFSRIHDASVAKKYNDLFMPMVNYIRVLNMISPSTPYCMPPGFTPPPRPAPSRRSTTWRFINDLQTHVEAVTDFEANSAIPPQPSAHVENNDETVVVLDNIPAYSIPNDILDYGPPSLINEETVEEDR